MCVAIYKPANAKLPSFDILRQCWETNPDGAGFAMPTRDNPEHAFHIRKGFMTWEAFEKAVRDFKLADCEGDLFLHFRIATHGGISPGNTHPFPVTKEVKYLQHTNILTNSVLIHNGVLPIKPEFRDISDTMELCRRLSGFHGKIPEALNLLEGFIGNSKIAVMLPGKVYLVGKWSEIDGVYFSNTHWQYRWEFEDDIRYPDENELRLLKQNICPDCDAQVFRDKTEFYCPDCGTVWTTAQPDLEYGFSERSEKRPFFDTMKSGWDSAQESFPNQIPFF